MSTDDVAEDTLVLPSRTYFVDVLQSKGDKREWERARCSTMGMNSDQTPGSIFVEAYDGVAAAESIHDILQTFPDVFRSAPARITVQEGDGEPRAIWYTEPCKSLPGGFYPTMEIDDERFYEVWPNASQKIDPVFHPVTENGGTMELTYIPPGEPLLGEDKIRTFEGGFWIAKTPATQNEYDGTSLPPGAGDLPKVMVSWNDCVAWGQARGLVLPSETEWEYAARGTDGRTYPWGEEAPSDRLLVWSGNVRRESRAPVGTCPDGASPFGLLDMAGNVWEWTRTEWSQRMAITKITDFSEPWDFSDEVWVRVPLRTHK